MFEDSEDISLDKLKVEDYDVQPIAVLPVSVIVCETEFVKPVIDVSEAIKRFRDNIFKKYTFKTPERRRFKEGFLEFSVGPNTVECFYAREAPMKVNYEADDLKIHTDRMRLISPTFSVKNKVAFSEKGAKVTMFGGSDLMIQKALNQINYCIRDSVPGGHRTISPSFSKEDMSAILETFGVNVEYVWIHPGESEKFIKIVEKKVKGEIRRVPEYIVHAKLMGYHITGSPVAISLIRESGIYLREIQGKLNFAVKIDVTTRVSATGKILFYIPESLLGRDNTFFDVAEVLYNRIAIRRAGPKQVTLGEYFVEGN